MKSLFLILGNQLFPQNHLNKHKNSTFFMCESYDLCTFQKHHKLKLILFLSSMRSYAEELKKNKFKIKSEKYFRVLPNKSELRFFGFLEKLPPRIFPFIFSHYNVVAQK